MTRVENSDNEMKKFRIRNKTTRNRIHAYLFLAPNIIGFAIFTFLPVIASFVLSFMRWDTANPVRFAGLDNFVRLFQDSSFIIAFWNTIVYTCVSIPIMVVLALCLALLLDRKLRGRAFFRAVHFFPYIASVVAVSVVWQFMYQPDFGPINSFLLSIGIVTPPRWLSSAVWAMPALIIMRVWMITGYYMVIFLAGLQNIPKQLYEAAKIDGANCFQAFRHITLPMLSPTTFFIVVIALINSFKVFDQVYIMTGGGPGRATSVMVTTIYNQAFVNFSFGYASAMSVILFLLIFSVTLIQFKIVEKWDNFML